MLELLRRQIHDRKIPFAYGWDEEDTLSDKARPTRLDWAESTIIIPNSLCLSRSSLVSSGRGFHPLSHTNTHTHTHIHTLHILVTCNPSLTLFQISIWIFWYAICSESAQWGRDGGRDYEFASYLDKRLSCWNNQWRAAIQWNVVFVCGGNGCWWGGVGPGSSQVS